MTPVIKTIYESANTDGTHTYGDGAYFEYRHEAELYSKDQHQGYGCRALEVRALPISEGTYMRMSNEAIIYIHGTEAYNEKIKANALLKLNDHERMLLGL